MAAHTPSLLFKNQPTIVQSPILLEDPTQTMLLQVLTISTLKVLLLPLSPLFIIPNPNPTLTPPSPNPDDKIPTKLAYDYTSQGHLWDPTLSAFFYTYAVTTKEFESQPKSKKTPVDWLKFEGRWGDEEYGMERKGQEDFHGFKKWTSGPQGPWFKHCEFAFFRLF